MSMNHRFESFIALATTISTICNLLFEKYYDVGVNKDWIIDLKASLPEQHRSPPFSTFYLRNIMMLASTKIGAPLNSFFYEYKFVVWTLTCFGVLSDWYRFEEDLWCCFDNRKNIFYSLQIGYMRFHVGKITTKVASNLFDSFSRYKILLSVVILVQSKDSIGKLHYIVSSGLLEIRAEVFWK